VQALKSSFEREDPFGFRTTFVWFENYTRLFADPNYLNSLGKTAIFALA
jgi:sn-glycerol 3-phosphate transport system permease protein